MAKVLITSAIVLLIFIGGYAMGNLDGTSVPVKQPAQPNVSVAAATSWSDGSARFNFRVRAGTGERPTWATITITNISDESL